MEDVKNRPPKITYATLSADQMEDLHRELDAAIARVRALFGQSHPMFISGREVLLHSNLSFAWLHLNSFVKAE